MEVIVLHSAEWGVPRSGSNRSVLHEDIVTRVNDDQASNRTVAELPKVPVVPQRSINFRSLAAEPRLGVPKSPI